LFAARMQANAARAVALGLAAQTAIQPPPLYSFDGDIGRLTITTPAYNTAVLAVNQRAVPYGGVELARLYDGSQRVVANVGGRPWASFGVLVRDASAREVLFSQKPRTLPPPNQPLELLASPRGVVRRTKDYPARPYGGPFKTIVARGHTASPEVAVETTHRFKPDWIETRWNIRPRKRARYTVDVLFPSWGPTARVEAVLAGGRRVTLAAPGLPRKKVSLRNVAYFYIAGEETGYVVVPAGRRPQAVAHILRPKPQSSAPKPGPTLALQLAGQRKFKRLAVGVKIAPAADPAQAAATARRLRGSKPARPRPQR
jgi:hypothetical protein